MEDRGELEARVKALEGELARVKAAQVRGIRKRADWEILGLPAYDIALGPEPGTGQMRGHAKGFLAIGDMATGVVAIGGLARGLFAFGGAALGGFAFGGVSLGLIFALGGLALGNVAFGGVAAGRVAVGGVAVGVYALGGAAAGLHVIRPDREDPEALAFFGRYGIHPPARRGFPRR